jgi:hypothetical protein
MLFINKYRNRSIKEIKNQRGCYSGKGKYGKDVT